MIVPWDVWQKNNGGPRYFGTAEEYADIYGFVRAIPELFDGYEAVFCRGGGIPTSIYKFNKSPVVLQGNHDGVVAVVRCIPKSESAPVVIHLVDWNKPQSFTLIFDQTQFFFGNKMAFNLFTPTAYDQNLHEKIYAESIFNQLTLVKELTPERHPDGKLRLLIPPLNPWGIIKVSLK